MNCCSSHRPVVPFCYRRRRKSVAHIHWSSWAAVTHGWRGQVRSAALPVVLCCRCLCTLVEWLTFVRLVMFLLLKRASNRATAVFPCNAVSCGIVQTHEKTFQSPQPLNFWGWSKGSLSSGNRAAELGRIKDFFFCCGSVKRNGRYKC